MNYGAIQSNHLIKVQIYTYQNLNAIVRNRTIEDDCIQGSAHINKKFCFNLIYVFFSVFVPKFKQIETNFNKIKKAKAYLKY